MTISPFSIQGLSFPAPQDHMHAFFAMWLIIGMSDDGTLTPAQHGLALDVHSRFKVKLGCEEEFETMWR